MTEPLADDAPSVRPTRAQTSVRRRAYRRSQLATNGSNGGSPPVADLGPGEDTAPEAIDPVLAEPGVELEPGPTAEPEVMAPRRSKKRLVRARRVRRTIRSVDVLSLGKLAFVFNLCVLVMVLVAGVILWSVASASGSIDNIESFIEDIGFNDFQLRGDELLRGVAVGGFVMALTATGFIVLMGVLFNLLSDVVGGVRITMIEPDEHS